MSNIIKDEVPADLKLRHLFQNKYVYAVSFSWNTVLKRTQTKILGKLVINEKNIIFHPSSYYWSIPNQIKKNYIFPDIWDITNSGIDDNAKRYHLDDETLLKIYEYRRKYCNNNELNDNYNSVERPQVYSNGDKPDTGPPDSDSEKTTANVYNHRKYGCIWFFYQLALKHHIIDDLDTVFKSERTRNTVIVIGIYPLLSKKKLNHLNEWVKVYKTPPTITLTPSNITEFTKSKILDLAIRGKLVPQNSNDEPASMLLEHIRVEKEELIKQGKLKRDKKESIIYRGDDNSYYMTGKKEPLELPFNLPNGWTWACLPEIVFFQEGPGIMKADFCKEGIPLIRISGLQTDRVTLEGCNYLSPQKVEEKWAHFKLEKGDIVICTSASIGKVSIVDEEAVGAIPYTGQIRFQMTPAITKDYFLFFAMSNIYLDQVNMLKTGNCIQHYGPTHLKQVIVPLPPINEQIRISKTISKYLDQIDMISEQLL